MTASGRVLVDSLEVPSPSINEKFEDVAPSLGDTLPANSTYYYSACVDSVPNKSDTTNNCSEGILVSIDESYRVP